MTGYRITRNGNTVATVGGAAEGWTDTDRRPLTTYDYTVAALDGAGNASDAAALAVTTKADTSAPGRPRRVHVTHRHGRRITLAWAAAGDNVGVVRYRVYRVGRDGPVAATGSLHVRFRAKAGAGTSSGRSTRPATGEPPRRASAPARQRSPEHARPAAAARRPRSAGGR